ncbi:hypothetical protein LXA43DRAFT_1096308 [Ganoderma leucocontextum]|nr:hypothetical protein LXA43DRAFT_1096308 [Ganoderma leucocontextum]
MSAAAQTIPETTSASRDDRFAAHLVHLPLDIFYYIGPFIPQRDLSRIARTCRHLHGILDAGLAKHTVVKYEHLPSFQQWLRIGISDSGRSRACLLQHLTLKGLERYSLPLVLEYRETIIVQILANSPNLVSLSLADLSAVLSPQRLRTALITLPSLQHLTLSSVAPGYDDTLAGILPRLHTVDISYAPRWIGESMGFVDPFFLLRSHQHTLQTLSLDSVRLMSHDAPFAALRKLELRSVWLSDGVGNLIHLFPNIHELSLLDLHYTNPRVRFWRNPGRILERGYLDINDALELRNTSKAWQTAHGSWGALHHLAVETALGLYSLGLRCQVDGIQVLDTSTFAYAESDRELRAVMPAVLADVRPRRLAVDIPMRKCFEIISAVLGPLARSPSVTHLTVSFSLGMLLSIGLADILTKLGAILCDSAVSHLTIQVGREQSSDTVTSPSTHGACRRATSSAQEFAQGPAVPPSLKCLALELYFLGSVKVWHVGEEGMWEELRDSEGQRLMRVENMELSADAFHPSPFNPGSGTAASV